MHEGIMRGNWISIRKALWKGGLMHEGIIEGRALFMRYALDGRTDTRGQLCMRMALSK